MGHGKTWVGEPTSAVQLPCGSLQSGLPWGGCRPVRSFPRARHWYRLRISARGPARCCAASPCGGKPRSAQPGPLLAASLVDHIACAAESLELGASRQDPALEPAEPLSESSGSDEICRLFCHLVEEEQDVSHGRMTVLSWESLYPSGNGTLRKPTVIETFVP